MKTGDFQQVMERLRMLELRVKQLEERQQVTHYDSKEEIVARYVVKSDSITCVYDADADTPF